MIPNIPKEYLDGTEVNNGGIFDFSDKIFDPSRINAIIKLISKSIGGGVVSVIHLGACDHKNLIDDKIRRNEWLHKLLTENSSQCIGFDINEESVKYCHSIGWKNIYFLDMISQYEQVYEKISYLKKWNYLIAGEIVEHLDNPVAFLKCLNEYYKNRIDKIIITVPNAFRINNVKFSLEGKEGINTDHRYWFTPYTICKVVHRAGFKIEELLYTGSRLISINNQIFNLDNTVISDDLILIASF